MSGYNFDANFAGNFDPTMDPQQTNFVDNPLFGFSMSGIDWNLGNETAATTEQPEVDNIDQNGQQLRESIDFDPSTLTFSTEALALTEQSAGNGQPTETLTFTEGYDGPFTNQPSNDIQLSDMFNFNDPIDGQASGNAQITNAFTPNGPVADDHQQQEPATLDDHPDVRAHPQASALHAELGNPKANHGRTIAELEHVHWYDMTQMEKARMLLPMMRGVHPRQHEKEENEKGMTYGAMRQRDALQKTMHLHNQTVAETKDRVPTPASTIVDEEQALRARLAEIETEKKQKVADEKKVTANAKRAATMRQKRAEKKAERERELRAQQQAQVQQMAQQMMA